MKICITSEGNTLDSAVDPRFGRCKYFIIVDNETEKFEAIDNTNIGLTGGAGIQSAQLVASLGVKKVLTGNVGPNAFQTLQAAKIDIYTGVSGSVKEALALYKTGKLKITASASVGSKSGMIDLNK
ncbi:MAG: NifB/NifX family molybdenum-iron cluster-binding protein [Candidatus Firestonebacteria bacterium]